MKVILAARFSALAFAAALGVMLLYARTGLRIVGVLLPRQAWLVDHPMLWAGAWWLWLLAIFSWMVVLVALMWSYLPGHRVNSMLQTGLTVIAATLTIGGMVVWMTVLPFAAAHPMAVEFVPLTDAIAMALTGAGFFMLGAATAWIAVDLLRLRVMPRALLAPGVAAGLLFLPTPFVFPAFVPLVAAALLWIVWMLVLGLRRSLPSAYAEWQ